MLFAEITDNVITRRVDCDQSFATANGLVSIDGLSPSPDVGWTLVNGTWTAPSLPITEQNQLTLEQRAQTALTNNETFLAIASPTAAQAITQVQALTRQVNALIRLDLGLLDSITDA